MALPGIRRPVVEFAFLYRPTVAWTYSHHAHLTGISSLAATTTRGVSPAGRRAGSLIPTRWCWAAGFT